MNIMQNKTLCEFEKYLRLEEKAAATVEKYIRDVGRFLKSINGCAITKELAISYKCSLLEENYAKRSINSIIASLNKFFDFLGRGECKLKSLKLQKQLYCSEENELTRSEYERLVMAAKRQSNERLMLVIETICATGIRVSELMYINAQAVREGKAVVSLKGKTRTVFIVSKLQKKLLCYMKAQNITDGPIFVTKRGKCLNRTSVWREMKKLCESANVNPNKVFPHNLRHLFARTFYSIDRDIAKLADVLGHSSINTTRIYIITTCTEHRRLMENMHLII